MDNLRSMNIWVRRVQVRSQPVDDLGAPSLLPLTVENGAADLPIQLDQFSINRQRCLPGSCRLAMASRRG
jgi:hypothetical protein